MMKYPLVGVAPSLLVLLATACAGVPESGPPHHDSVRERLADIGAWLFIHDEASTGALVARRSTDGGSITSTTKLSIERGYVHVTLDRAGQLAIDQLEIDIAPFTMDRMFDQPAELQDVLLRLAEPVQTAPVWSSADEATASLGALLDVGWAIAFDGGAPVPAATQRLAPQKLELVLGGDGDHVDASLHVEAAGALWSCDDVQITSVTLALGAETAD